jgi:hypothetical protein
MKLTTHLQLVPRWRKHGSIHPPPSPIRLHGAVLNLLSTGTTLPLTCIFFLSLLGVEPPWISYRNVHLKHPVRLDATHSCIAICRGIWDVPCYKLQSIWFICCWAIGIQTRYDLIRRNLLPYMIWRCVVLYKYIDVSEEPHTFLPNYTASHPRRQ